MAKSKNTRVSNPNSTKYASKGNELDTVQRDWGPISKYKPVFTADSRYLLAASGCSVKVFNTATGAFVQELYGHETKVIGVATDKKEDENIFTCDESGEIFVWDLKKSVYKKRYRLQLKKDGKGKCKPTVSSFLLNANGIFVVAQYLEKSSSLLLGYKEPFESSSPVVFGLNVKPGQNKVSVSCSGKYVVHIECEGDMMVSGINCTLPNGVKRRRHMLGTRQLTSILCHPHDDVVATGDITGRIVLWYEVVNSKPITKVLHWHTLPVADLAFSVTGIELYSGGGECVLVRWHLKNDTRTFLPRLRMPLKYITTDANHDYLVTVHIDNAFSVIDAKEYKMKCTIQGLAMNVDNVEPFPAGIVYDPRTRALILNGMTGHLQFFDFYHNKQLYHLDITSQNYYTEERHEKIHNTEVIHCKVSPDGYWLATVEYREDFQASFELRLKFWVFRSNDQSWYLNTCVEAPHDKYVNGLVFQPSLTPEKSLFCVTCSDDCRFKIWKIMEFYDNSETRYTWRCGGVGFYRHFPAKAINISSDGSLIAAGFGNILTCWLPQSCHLKGTLSQPYLEEDIRQIEFGRGDRCGSLLVTRTDGWICSWDLLTCTLRWKLSLQSRCLAVDPRSSYMALFTSSCKVIVFQPSSSEAICDQKIGSSPAVAAAFIPRIKQSNDGAAWKEQSILIFIDENQALQIVENKETVMEKVEGHVKRLVQETSGNIAPTPFAALIAQTRITQQSEEKDAVVESAGFGVAVEKSSLLLQKVINDSRVYRFESFATLTSEFCKTIIPEAVTSAAKQAQEEHDIEVKKKEELIKKTLKKVAKQKRKDLKRAPNSDFTELISMLEL